MQVSNQRTDVLEHGGDFQALFTLQHGGHRFINFVEAIRGSAFHSTEPAAAPVHLNGHVARRFSGGKDQHRIGAGHVTAAADHLLALPWDRAAEQGDFRADALRIRSQSFQANRHAGSARRIAINSRGRAEFIHHHIEIAVAIQIRDRDAVMDAGRVQAPVRRDLAEAILATVLERDDGSIEPGIVTTVEHFLGDERFMGRHHFALEFDQPGALGTR